MIDTIEKSKLITDSQEMNNEVNRQKFAVSEIGIINIDDSDGEQCIDELFPMSDVSPTINSNNSSISSLEQVTTISDLSINNEEEKNTNGSIQISDKNENKKEIKNDKNVEIKKENKKEEEKDDKKDVVDNKKTKDKEGKEKEEKRKEKDKDKKVDEKKNKENSNNIKKKNNESGIVKDNSNNRNRSKSKSYNSNRRYSNSRSNSRDRERNYSNRKHKHSSRSRSRSRSNSYDRKYYRDSRSRSNNRRRKYYRDSRSRSRSYDRHTHYSSSRSRSRSRSNRYDNSKRKRERSHSKSYKKDEKNKINKKPPIYKNATPPKVQSLSSKTTTTNNTSYNNNKKSNIPVVEPPKSIVQKAKQDNNNTTQSSAPNNSSSSSSSSLSPPVSTPSTTVIDTNRGELLSIFKDNESESQNDDKLIDQSVFNDFINSSDNNNNNLPPITEEEDESLFNNNNNNSNNSKKDDVDYTTIEYRVPLYAPCRPGEPVGSVKIKVEEGPKKIKPFAVRMTDRDLNNNNNNNNISSPTPLLPFNIPSIQQPPPQQPQLNNNNNIPYSLPLTPSRIDITAITAINRGLSSPSIQQQSSFNNNNLINNNNVSSGIILDPRLQMNNQQQKKTYAIFSGVEKVDCQYICQYFNIIPINSDTPYTAFQNRKVNISYVFVHTQLYHSKDYKNQFGYYCYLLSDNCRLLTYKYLEDSFASKQLLDPTNYTIEPPRRSLNVFRDIGFQVEGFDDSNSIEILILLGGGFIVEPISNESKRSRSCMRVVKRIDGVVETRDNIVTERHIRRCIKHPELYHI